MTFYVGKSLAQGPIRFGVSPRLPLESIDSDPGLSTGAAGEFLRRRAISFYFADSRRFDGPRLPVAPTVSSTPFWSSLQPDGTRRGWGFLALFIFGAIFLLLGIGVVVNKGPAGWVEIILGIGMIATPIVMTAQKRKQLRAQEEKERAEREAREKREREMLAAYVSALDELRRDPTNAAIARAERERAALELPYEIWSPLARRTLLTLGFAELAGVGPARAGEVNEFITRIARATGLSDEDELAVKHDLYRAYVWHLLVDDRIGETQNAELLAFRKGFGIWDRELPVEAKALEEFRKLRGITRETVPRVQCPMKLAFREYCIHATRGTKLKKTRKGMAPDETCSVYVTNKRVVIDTKKKIEDIPLPKIDDVEVDVDANVLTIATGGGIKPVSLQVEEPIYSAALIDLATAIDERPKGFS